MSLKIDRITIAARDVARARRFYEDWLGRVVHRDSRDTFSFEFGADASEIAVRSWPEVAADAGVAEASEGFRGFTLSYIVESADAVDAVLDRAQRAGGVISKRPRNAMWGYSAYITDPMGCLWKVASVKRKPLLSHGRSRVLSPDGGGAALKPKEIPVTIGVKDIARAKAFYEDGVGLAVKKAYRKFVMFTGRDGTSALGMYTREALADDAAVPAAGDGFRGFTLTHVVDTPSDVDGLLATAAGAGGQLVSPRLDDDNSYGGCFADPDGNLWIVRSREASPSATASDRVIGDSRLDH